MNFDQLQQELRREDDRVRRFQSRRNWLLGAGGVMLFGWLNWRFHSWRELHRLGIVCNGWTLAQVRKNARVTRWIEGITSGRSLPSSAHNIWVQIDEDFRLDPSDLLTFRATPGEIREFAQKFSDNSLDRWPDRSQTFFLGNNDGPRSRGGLPWRPGAITNGRFHETGWPVIAVDLEQGVVYVIG